MKKKPIRSYGILPTFVSHVDEADSVEKSFRKNHVSSETKQIPPENLPDPSSIRIHSRDRTQTTVDSRPLIHKKRKNRKESDQEGARLVDDRLSSVSAIGSIAPKAESQTDVIVPTKKSRSRMQESGFLDSMEEKNSYLFQSSLDTTYSKPREFVSISVMVKSVEPISAHMEVNVSLPTTMSKEFSVEARFIQEVFVHPAKVFL